MVVVENDKHIVEQLVEDTDKNKVVIIKLLKEITIFKFSS